MKKNYLLITVLLSFFSLSAENKISYMDVDYSSIIPINTTIYGEMNEDTPIVQDTYQKDYVEGYTFEIEEGKIYHFTFDIYAPFKGSLSTSIQLLKSELQGVFYKDILSGNLWIETKDYHLRQEKTYIAEASGVIKLLVTADFSEKIIYTLKVEELDLLTFTPVEIPYLNEEINFSDKKGFFKKDDERFFCFTFTLQESTTLYFYSNPLDLYISSSPFTQYEVDNQEHVEISSDNYSRDFEPGTYYIALKSYNAANNYFSTAFAITTSEQIPLEQIPVMQLNNIYTPSEIFSYAKLIPTVPFTDSGIFMPECSKLLYDHQDLFIAEAYKINMSQNSSINIHLSAEVETSLFIYRKEIDGNYSSVSEENRNQKDYFLDLTSNEAGEYYILAMTHYGWPDSEEGYFYLTVWQGENEPTNQFPEKYSVKSLSSNQNYIIASVDASEMEILFLLNNLVVTGTGTKEDNSVISLANLNNPFYWEINPSKTEARFVPITTLTSGLIDFSETVPLTIKIYNNTTDIGNLSNGKLYVYGRDNTIYIMDAKHGSVANVFDIMGRMVANKTIGADFENIPVNKPGIYLVHIENKVYKILCK